MPEIELSIIIVSWNVKTLLEKCLQSIKKNNSVISSEIIVVDNASSDGSAEYITARFPDVMWIQNHENVGFPKANNIGIEKSSGKYIVLLNPDTLLIEDSFRKMIDVLEQNDHYGAVGCKLIDENGKIDFNCSRNFPTISNILFEPYLAKFSNNWIKDITMKHWDHLSNRIVDVVSGACFMVSRSLLDKIGYLDENIFVYVDDDDLCYRIKASGKDVYYLADTAIIHYGMQSVKQNYVKLRADSIRSMRRFFTKHKSFIYGASYELLAIIDFIFKYFVFSALSLFTSKRSKTAIKENFQIAFRLIARP
jgi:hypothetical protein